MPDIITLAKSYPNFTGIYLDDFVTDPVKQPDGRKVGKPAMTEAELKSMREQLGKLADGSVDHHFTAASLIQRMRITMIANHLSSSRSSTLTCARVLDVEEGGTEGSGKELGAA